METTTIQNDLVRSEVYWANVTDMLSQAINGEIVGMANFAMLTGTIDDVHEMFECVEHSNCERGHAEGFIQIAKKYDLPVIINQEGYYWRTVREVFKKWAEAKDYIGCIIIQEVILECFAVSLYKMPAQHCVTMRSGNCSWPFQKKKKSILNIPSIC
jgi:hypothetical protein